MIIEIPNKYFTGDVLTPDTDVHIWLKENHVDYKTELLKTKPPEYERLVFVRPAISIKDEDAAVLFKLTWGGSYV